MLILTTRKCHRADSFVAYNTLSAIESLYYTLLLILTAEKNSQTINYYGCSGTLLYTTVLPIKHEDREITPS